MSLLANSNAIESGGYNIDRSLRFRSSASAYLNRTFGSTGNQQKWTWSGWAKGYFVRASGDYSFFGVTDGTGATATELRITAAGYLNFYCQGTGLGTSNLVSSSIYRDPAAFYHIICAVDTTQATAADRIKLYVNGVQVTSFSTGTYQAQNSNTYVGTTAFAHIIGKIPYASIYLDGYLAEVNFIDGQALTPSSFGEFSTETGVWVPKKYTGTYGTNGFYLPFTDNTSATTLASDKSGNGNNWTANNISTTAGATYDSMTDVPTLTSATAANYSTWNPINNGLGGTVSNANLTLSGVSVVASRINSTIGVSSGKWYFETTLTTAGDYTTVGIGQGNITNQYPGNDALSYAQTLERATSINSNTQPAYGTALVGGDVFMCAFDLDNNKVFFGKNGTWFGTSNPETGANPAYTIAAGTYNAIARPNPSGFSTTAVLNTNFGQRPFSYTPPTGFKALNTFNLPDPTIKKPNQYMQVDTYQGSGTARDINLGMQPDLVWIKSRTSVESNNLFDSVRGSAGNYKTLQSNTTGAEITPGIAMVTALNSNGFSLGTNAGVNGSPEQFVAWNWKKGATPGFDIVTYTGNGVAGRTVAHNLGVAPAMMIVKNRNSTQGWQVQHQSLTSITYNLYLQATDSQQNDAQFLAKSATTVTLNQYSTNTNGNTYVMYLFAEVAGFSKFGSYTGNGSADGPFVFTNFKPAYVMIKRTDAAGVDWQIKDIARDPYNAATHRLWANLSDAEGSGTAMDFLSNGFKIRESGAATNTSGGTYIYCAFAANPFKSSLGQ